eukprot:TRINITY_DN8186_c0_g1_i1.p1 TRINITY_DN8186_c0_g1~~TRINITY_DN8186_c0_g1_i1.p1  ORF type:complete len:957 (+),score=225.39 TRINITY_DN8186_c0_g1_i1:364-2871(+)
MAEQSEVVSGDIQASGSDCSHQSGSHSRSSGERLSVASEGYTIEELQDRVDMLKGALADRDDQQAILLQKLVLMEQTSNESLGILTEKLRESKTQQTELEASRDKLEVKSAGARARHDANISRLTVQKEELKVEMNQQKAAMQKSESTVRETQEKQEVDQKHNQRLHDHNKEVNEQLRNEITSLTRELQLQKNADASTAVGQEDDRFQRQEKERLREELHELLASKQKDREQMTAMRLEMLGLRRSAEIRQVDSREDISGPFMPSASRTLPKFGKGKSKHNRSGKGKVGKSIGMSKGRGPGKASARGTSGPLDSIDEEEEDDLPSLQEAAWASECVSSDAGDSVDEMSLDDISEHQYGWQADLVRRIQEELDAERQEKQALQDNIASQNAEHALETQLLQQKALVHTKMHEQLEAESQRFKDQAFKESIRSIHEIDKLQVTLRSMEDRVDEQKAQLVQKSMDEEQRKADKEQLEEQLNLSNEQLRLAGLRLEDSKQQQMYDAVQQRREMTNLKMELAMERCQPRSGHSKEVADETPEEEADLRHLIADLQEERNILMGKLEAKEVHFRVQLEELEMQYNAKICELQNDFNCKLEELRQDNHRSVGESMSPQAQSLQSVVTPTASASDISTPRLSSEGDASESPACLHSMIWSVLSLIPNLAILLCSLEGFIIRQVSEKACALLDMELSGQMFFGFLRESTSTMSLKRSILVNQSMADNSRTHTPGFAAHKLGRYELCTKRGRRVTAGISMAHLPARSGTGEERSLLLILAEDASGFVGGTHSAASSDICPSDSVSVCQQKDRSNLTEATRKNLRASFFSSRQSASAVSSASSADP